MKAAITSMLDKSCPSYVHSDLYPTVFNMAYSLAISCAYRTANLDLLLSKHAKV